MTDILGQAKDTLMHIYGKTTCPKNIGFIDCKHFSCKGNDYRITLKGCGYRMLTVKQECYTKAANVGCLRIIPPSKR